MVSRLLSNSSNVAADSFERSSFVSPEIEPEQVTDFITRSCSQNSQQASTVFLVSATSAKAGKDMGDIYNGIYGGSAEFETVPH